MTASHSCLIDALLNVGSAPSSLSVYGSRRFLREPGTKPIKDVSDWQDRKKYSPLVHLGDANLRRENHCIPASQRSVYDRWLPLRAAVMASQPDSFLSLLRRHALVPCALGPCKVPQETRHWQ